MLEAQQQLFPAELALARVMRDQLTIVVMIYRALGGGWAVDADGWEPGVLSAATASPDVRPQSMAGSGSATAAANEGVSEQIGGSAP